MQTHRKPRPSRKSGVTVESLRALSKRVELAEFRLLEAKAARDNAILEASAAGYSGPRLAQLLGITEGRVRQIVRAGHGAIDGRFNGEQARLLIDHEGDLVKAVALRGDEDGEYLEDVH